MVVSNIIKTKRNQINDDQYLENMPLSFFFHMKSNMNNIVAIQEKVIKSYKNP